MNKIYRLVWNRSLRAPVVASELATRSVSGSSRTKAGPQAVGGVLAGAMIAMLAIPPDAEAIVGITRKAVNGTTCEADADEGDLTWNPANDARCHPGAGSGPSGVGNPGTNVVIHSSGGTSGTEDSIALGGYLDVWKPASFWGGIDMRGNSISNLKPGVKEGDAATVGQVNKVAGDLANIANGKGIKYFRANSSQADAQAKGSNSVAIGPTAIAEGGYSQALGSNAKSAGGGSLAIGDRAATEADASGAVAVGPSAIAKEANTVALGGGSVADRANTVSVGSASRQRQVANVAKGTQDNDAVNVSQLKGVTSALGSGAAVAADGSVTAPGYNVGGKKFNNVGDALGDIDGRIGGNTTAINGINSGAGIKYFRSNSSKPDATAKGVDSVAIGPNAIAEGGYSQAMGGNAKSAGGASVAIGDRAATDVAASGAVAIGPGANAKAATSVALGGGSVADRANTVSVGSASSQRQVANVAKGTQDNDAVNVSQLKGVTSALGSGAAVAADGSVTAPGYNVGGKKFNNVGDALGDIDGRIGENTAAINSINGINNGAGIKYFRSNSSQPDASAKGVDSVAIGPNAIAEGGYSQAMGGNAKSAGGASVAIGDRAATDVAASGAVAVGPGANAKAATSVALGGGSVADRANTVSVGSASNQRQVTNVAKGTQDNDAVNIAQIKRVTSALGGGAGVAGNGAVKAPSYNVGGKTVDNVGDALAGVDGRVSQLGDQVNKGEVGLVRQDPGTRSVTVGKDTNGKKVDLKGTEGDRVVTGVADGSIAKASKDAVTGGQLYNTEKATTDALGGGAKVNPDGSVSAPAYKVGGKTVNNVGDALTTVDGRVTQVDGRVTTLGDQISKGEIGLVKQDATSRKITVAKDRDGTQVDFTGTSGTRVLNGVSKGAITATSVEAINGAQLHGTNKAMADSLGGGAKLNPDGSVSGPAYKVGDKSVGNVGDAIAGLGDMINNASADGLVKQDLTSRDITVGKGSNGKKVDLKGTEGERLVTGVADGTVSKDAKDAVNGGQLYAAEKASVDALGGGAKVNPDGSVSGPTYNVGGKAAKNVGDALSAVDGRVTHVDGRVTTLGDQISKGEIGLVKQDASSRKVTVAKDRDGTQVDFTGTSGTRVLNGVSKGAITATSVEAINGAQLHGTNKVVADSLGGGAKLNPDGSVSGPAYKVGDKSVGNVGDAIAGLGDMINNASADGLVKQDLASRDITVGKASNGKKVDLKGTEGERLVTGVADGSIVNGSKDAVTGGQLFNAEKATADALGGGAKVNPNGSVSGPAYKVGGKTVNNVGDALTTVDGRVTQVDGRVTSLGEQIAKGEIGLVKQDPATQTVTVAKDTAGKQVDMKGSDGERIVTGVADGAIAKGSKDAVTGGQMHAGQKAMSDALGGGAKVNPDGSVNGPVYDVGGRTVNNVGDAIDNIDGRVTTLGDTVNGINNGAGIKYFRANSSLADAVASGADSVAVGPLAKASAANAVALGKGSVADRANTVSVGSASSQRQLVNVAKGTQDTDAVNLAQLKGATNALGGGAQVKPDGSVTGPTYNVGGKSVGNVGDALSNLGDMINNASADGLVKQDLASRAITVGKTSNGGEVDFTGTAGSRVLKGVSKGAISAASAEAINGEQLHGTNQAVADSLGGGAKLNSDGSVSGPSYKVGDKRVGNVGDAISNLGDMINNVSADGVVKQDLESRDINVGKSSNGKKVNLKGTEGERIVTGVADGSIAKASKDAVTGGQLYNAEKATADALGGGAKVNPDGSMSGPTYTVGGKTVGNVGDAIKNVDGRVSLVDGRVTTLGDQISNGEIGLVKQDASNRKITVAKDRDGRQVDFSGTAGTRVLNGVSKGAITATSVEAINGAQLHGTNKAVADSLGGGAKVNPDGSVSGPTYTVGGKNVGNVGEAISNLGDMINNVSADGLVKQDLTTRDVTVGKDSNGKEIDLKGTDGERVVTGVADGAIAKGSKDAVTGGQLHAAQKASVDALGGGAKVNPDGSVTAPTYHVGGKTVSNVGDAIDSMDGRVTNLGDTVNGINNGAGIKYFRANSSLSDAAASGIDSVAIGPQADASAANAVALGKGSVADRANTVSVGSASGQRQLVHVAKGTQDTDAVNVSQLKGATEALGGGAQIKPDGSLAGPTYKVGDKRVTNVGDAISNLGDMINNVSADGLAKQDLTTRDISVGKDSDGKRIDLKGTDGERVVTGVADGAIAKGSKDVVTGGQAYAGQKATADALGGGAKVNPDGSVSGPTYKVGGKTVSNVGDALTTVDGRVTQVDGRVTTLGEQIAKGEVGLVKQDPSTQAVTVAKDTGGKRIDLKGNEGERVVTGVADGAITQGSKDVVTGGQVFAGQKATADALGGGAKVNPDGSVSGPTYNVGGKTVSNVGDAITHVDGRVNNLDGRVGSLGQQIDNGEIGLVQQDAASRKITMAKDRDGTQVDFAGISGSRVLTGLSKGAITATSVEAINGAQLHGTNKAVADSLGGGAKVNPDGSVSGPTYTVGGKNVGNVGEAISNLGDMINNVSADGLVKQDLTTRDVTVGKDSNGRKIDLKGTDGERVVTGVADGAIAKGSKDAVTGGQLHAAQKASVDALGGDAKVNPDGSVSSPTYNVGGKTVSNVGDALTTVDGRVTQVDGRVTTLGEQIAKGEVGLVRQDPSTQAVTVAKDTGGKRIDLSGTDGGRVVTGVADGAIAKGSKDVVTGGQVYAGQKATADALGGGAKLNPDGSVSRPTYTVGGKTVGNVGDALTEVDGRMNGVDARVTHLGDQVNGGKGIKYFRANSSLADAVATGMDSIAIGPMATAQAANAVALGKGSLANRGNTVSVGAAGRERQVVNVAKGTQGTDAVNLSQLKPLADSLGGGAKVNPDGSVTRPTYQVGGKTVSTVGDAITNLGDMISSSQNGPSWVEQDSASRDIEVAARTDGKRVNFAGTEGRRVLAGVANGSVQEASNEAVNGAQLHKVAKSVAEGLGGGAQVNPDGSVSGPAYRVGGKTVNNAGDAVTNLDGRVASNAEAIRSITDGKGVKYFHANSTGEDSVASGAESVAAGSTAHASGTGSVAVGHGARASADNSVALGAGSVADKAGTVSVGSAGKERKVTHVAAGQSDTDAVNLSQLKNSQAGSIRYDAPTPGAAPDYDTLTLGGPGGGGTTTVRKVAAGKAPTDAVNVQQMQDGMAQALGKANSYTDGRFQQVKEDAWVARREARGGTAAAMAMAGMPQAYLPGANMLSAGVGNFQGETAMAVGLSGVTDNGRYIYKAQASGNTSGEFGFSVGAGIQW